MNENDFFRARISVYALALLCLISIMSMANETAPTTASAKPLAGKVICVDAGHGGNESGAVGKQGTIEKNVNLKVALMLRDMLAASGAEVIMTRSDDTPISLGDRARLNKEKDTDLFVSVHHNANAQGDDTMNRIEVFWHWKDDGGPSEDLARLILREFQAASERPGKAYLCWAYGVLRENKFPAVLGEFSYLQNPAEEQRLQDDVYLRTQAEAYHRAVLAFFDSGRPVISKSENSVWSHMRPQIRILPSETGGSPVDPQLISATVAGVPVGRLRYEPLTGDIEMILHENPPTSATLRVTARNLDGRYSEVAHFTELPPVLKRYSTDASSVPPLILIGKTFVVDPAGGGDDAGAVAPNGLRAADVNLLTAQYLADYIRRAGGRVVMTRDRDEARDNVARVRLGLETNPDAFLTISYRTVEPGMGEKAGENRTRIGHRWGDGGGIAKAILPQLRAMMGTGDPASRDIAKDEVHNWSSWEAMHGAQNYSAICITPLMFDGEGAAARLSGTAAARKAAQGILYGLFEYYGADEAQNGQIDGQVVDADSGAPVCNALVWLQNDFPVQTEADGKFRIKYLDHDTQYALFAQARDYSHIMDDLKSDKPDKKTMHHYVVIKDATPVQTAIKLNKFKR